MEDQLCNLRHVIDCNFLWVSDIGQVWGWGYGGEGQLGLGSRIRMVSSPHLVPCINSSSYGKDISASLARGSMSSDGQNFRVPGSYIKGIACGGRHSAVITGKCVSVYCILYLKLIYFWTVCISFFGEPKVRISTFICNAIYLTGIGVYKEGKWFYIICYN